MDPQKHRHYVGADNALILDNIRKLLKSGAKVWVRIPVIPGVNDSPEEMRRIKAFLDSCETPLKVELLPYHAMGENKYRALGTNPQKFAVPDSAAMQNLRNIFL